MKTPLPRRVYLVGMPGSGKSTLGKRAAAALGWPFVDLDRRLELNARQPIAEIVRERGEGYFRGLERTTLRLTAREPEPTLIATGGGAPAFFDNMAFMLSHGLTVYLHCPVKGLAERLSRGARDRPLLWDESGAPLSDSALRERLEGLYARRAEHYERAACKLLAETPLGGEDLAAVIADWYGL